jgi:hypothetical protein
VFSDLLSVKAVLELTIQSRGYHTDVGKPHQLHETESLRDIRDTWSISLVHDIAFEDAV